LIDGSALFLTVRSMPDNRPLDYRAFVDLLVEQIPGLQQPAAPTSDSRWVMWTAASPQNEGQNRFLDFAESQLRWEVRRVGPVDSFLIEPAQLGLAADNRPAVSRLVRFDASIAFAIGRLADTHRVVVVSDSYALADPLHRAATVTGSEPLRQPHLAFFGRALDSRWQRLLLKGGPVVPVFIDLDDHEARLFGFASSTEASTSTLEGLVF